jgi:hypothetical protein
MARRNGLDHEAAKELHAIAPRFGSTPAAETVVRMRGLMAELAVSLGFELTRPPLPRKGEDVLVAACRVLELGHVAEALEQNHAAREFLAEARAEVEGWRTELRELQAAELVRRRDKLKGGGVGGRLPGLAPVEKTERAARLFFGLLLVDSMPGSGSARREVVPPAEHDRDVLLAALRPPDFLPAIIYLVALADRLELLHEGRSSARSNDRGAFQAARQLANLGAAHSDEPVLCREILKITSWIRPLSSPAAMLQEALVADTTPL